MSRGLGSGRVGAAIGKSGVGSSWRAFFWAACLFNLVIGALGMLSPAGTIDTRVVGLLVFSFGVVYLFVARDPQRYAQVLWAGVIGKTGVVALLAPQALADGANPFFGVVLALDALFALGFLVFLFRKSATEP